ncbi:MAG TPA: 3-methyl-2-oxobutanoate hydroxymethyltransferase [Opitutaceae bacterium]|jgi:3-methyl-2-oxobutanoate hydroxymethyltransferase|nr:3-methyl-2-oxobutanoate hydroxymethyltransferase [Opitutaceae bacterium]
MKNVLEFARAKRDGSRIVLVTAYDFLMARLLAASEVDAILVGDSAAMVVHGYPSTVSATVEMMCAHTAAVRRGAPDRFIVSDMPFLSARKGREAAVAAAGALMQAGASAVKVEGVAGHGEVISYLVESGIPVMGHLGLTPQSVHQLGGNRVQARTKEAADRLHREAAELAARGAFAVVLECVPAAVAAQVTAACAIPTIGIGAGRATDGQVLVLSDLLGWDPVFRPMFARRYHNGYGEGLAAVNAFVRDVRAAQFPADAEIPA